jgi:hypothetical protein
MTTTQNLKTMSLDGLVKRFAGIAERLGLVLFELVSPMDMPGREAFVAESEQLYADLDVIDGELRSRGREARLALMQLYDSPILQVRLQAAHHTLGVAPKAARAQLEDIAQTGWMEGMSAHSTIEALDRGVFKPD